jgi:hypothetical protein
MEKHLYVSRKSFFIGLAVFLAFYFALLITIAYYAFF